MYYDSLSLLKIVPGIIGVILLVIHYKKQGKSTKWMLNRSLPFFLLIILTLAVVTGGVIVAILWYQSI